MWMPWRQTKSSLPVEVDFLILCERNVRSIEDLAKAGNLLNQRQCLDMSSKLSTTTLNIRELVVQCGASAVLFRPALENLYRYLEKAKLLVHQCAKEDWCAAAVFQIQNENAFREILLDSSLCYNAMYEQAKSMSEERNIVLPIDLRQSSIFLPATGSDVREDEQDLQKRLDDLASGHTSVKLLNHFQREIVALKQCISRYLLVKSKYTSEQSQAKTLDTCSAILWTKDSEPRETWGNNSFLGAGSGASGVCSTKWLGIPCAKKEFHGRASESSFLKEAGILAHLKHPHIVTFICCGNGQERGDRFIAMELMEKSLANLIEEQNDVHFSIPVVVDMIVQIARGMCYLHDQGVAHRDLKPQNVVVNRLTSPHLVDHFCVKLVDFGMSKTKVEVSKSNTMSVRGVGTTSYRAPEVHPKAHLDGTGKAIWFKADVYSFAITCTHVLSLKTLFGDVEDRSELYNELMNGRRPKLPGDCPQELVMLLRDCWEISPRSRPSFVEICTRLEKFRLKILRGLSPLHQGLKEERMDFTTGFEFIKVKLEEHLYIQRPSVDNINDEAEGEMHAFLEKSDNLLDMRHCVLSIVKATKDKGMTGMQAKITNSTEGMAMRQVETENIHDMSYEMNTNDVVSIIPCTCGCALELLPQSPYNDGSFCCNVCFVKGDGEVYRCETCQFDAHPDCAQIKNEVKMFWHDNPLHLLVQNYYKHNPYAYCDFCLELVQDSEWVYKCKHCNLDVHALCTKYCEKMVHQKHPHLLTLVKFSTSNSLFCTCCNGELEGYYYTCTQKLCAIEMHPFCANFPAQPLCIFNSSHRLILITRRRGFHCSKCGTLGFSWFYRCDHCNVHIHLECVNDAEEEEDDWNGDYEKFMLEHETKDNNTKINMVLELLDKLEVNSSSARPTTVTMRVQPIQRLTSLEILSLDTFYDVNVHKKIGADTIERKVKKMIAKEARQKLKAKSKAEQGPKLENLEKLLKDLQSSKSMSQINAEILASAHIKLKKIQDIMEEVKTFDGSSSLGHLMTRKGPRIGLQYRLAEHGTSIQTNILYIKSPMAMVNDNKMHLVLLCEEPGHEHIASKVVGCVIRDVEIWDKIQPLLASGLQVVTRAMSTKMFHVSGLDCVPLTSLSGHGIFWDLHRVVNDLQKQDEENVESHKRAQEFAAELLLRFLENNRVNIFNAFGLLRVRYIVTEDGNCPRYRLGNLAWLCTEHLNRGLEAGTLESYPLQMFHNHIYD